MDTDLSEKQGNSTGNTEEFNNFEDLPDANSNLLLIKVFFYVCFLKSNLSFFIEVWHLNLIL